MIPPQRLLKVLIPFFFLFLFTLSDVYAQRLPLWELGAAGGYANLPYYRGSSQSRNVVLPLPLAIYRGKKLKVDEDGARHWLFKTDYTRLDLSLGLGLPVPKDAQIDARKGMPAIPTLLEAGPVLDILLWRQKWQILSLHLPLRAAFSLDWLRSDYEGFLFAPYVNYTLRSLQRNYWELNVALGPQYASSDYHAYYYSVAPKYQTSARGSYDAQAGYSGSRITVYANKRLGNLWMSAFLRYDYLDKAVFNDSPLVETNKYFIGGFVLGWVFKESLRTVAARAPDWFAQK